MLKSILFDTLLKFFYKLRYISILISPTWNKPHIMKFITKDKPTGITLQGVQIPEAI